MAAQKKYPDELRERAVKMLFEVREREGKGRGELARVARQLAEHEETAEHPPDLTHAALRCFCRWRDDAGPSHGASAGTRVCPLVPSGM